MLCNMLNDLAEAIRRLTEKKMYSAKAVKGSYLSVSLESEGRIPEGAGS